MIKNHNVFENDKRRNVLLLRCNFMTLYILTVNFVQSKMYYIQIYKIFPDLGSGVKFHFQVFSLVECYNHLVPK